MRRTILVHLAAFGLLSASLTACGASPTSSASDSRLTEAPTDQDILFEAIVATFRARNLPTSLVDNEKGVVLSEWEELSSELRRRYVARTVPAGKGLLLRVVAEFQRRDRTGSRPTWIPAEDQLTADRARREEHDLGSEIQTRFDERRKKR